MALMNDSGVPLSDILIGFLCGPMLVFMLLSVLLWRRHTFVAAAEPEAVKPTDHEALEVGESAPMIARAALMQSHATQQQPAVVGIDRKKLMALPFLRQVISAEFLCFVVFLDLALLRVRLGEQMFGTQSLG